MAARERKRERARVRARESESESERESERARERYTEGIVRIAHRVLGFGFCCKECTARHANTH